MLQGIAWSRRAQSCADIVASSPRIWTYPHRLGRPPVEDALAVLIERMARENQSWGYQKNPGWVA
jgi:hypothetical protein